MGTESIRKLHLIFTVIAPNYLLQALTLGASIARNMPEVDFRVLVLQDCENVEYISNAMASYSNINTTKSHFAESINDIDWQDFDVSAAANQYDLLEFATSVKPALLRHYLAQGWERVTYLDPDIYVYKDFSETLDDSHSVSLTPHILRDYPADGKYPDHTVILKSGVFNLGFVSVRPCALQFLDWWSRKLQKFCTIDFGNGFFVDQRWMDWSISLTQPQIIRHPGMNVSYWNLHDRQIVENGSEFEVSAEGQNTALYFYHFSGFDVDSPGKLSKYCDRIFPQDVLPKSFLQSYIDKRKSWEYGPPPSGWSIAGRLNGEKLPDRWRNSMLVGTRQEGIESENIDALIESAVSGRAILLAPFVNPNCQTCGNCDQPFARKAMEHLAIWFQVHESGGEIKHLEKCGYSGAAIEFISQATPINLSRKLRPKIFGFFTSQTSILRALRIWKLLPISWRRRLRPWAAKGIRRFL